MTTMSMIMGAWLIGQTRSWRRIRRAKKKTNIDRLRGHFGSNPNVLAEVMEDDNRYTPSLSVILSTRSPLEQGRPWIEQLVFDSIRLDTPAWVYLLDPSLLRPGRLLDVLAAQIRKLRLGGDPPLDMARNVVSTHLPPPNLTGADLSTIGLLTAVQRRCRQAEEEVRPTCSRGNSRLFDRGCSWGCTQCIYEGNGKIRTTPRPV
jgi:hypothetical protein